jgi:hypothetical protein
MMPLQVGRRYYILVGMFSFGGREFPHVVICDLEPSLEGWVVAPRSPL